MALYRVFNRISIESDPIEFFIEFLEEYGLRGFSRKYSSKIGFRALPREVT